MDYPQDGQICKDQDKIPSLSDYLLVFAAAAVVVGGRSVGNLTGVSGGMEVA